MLTLIKQGTVKVLVGLGLILMSIACKIDADHTEEIYYFLKIDPTGKPERK